MRRRITGNREVGWDDPDVCAPYMARFCPHDLFINTKSNLGNCPKIHDPILKQRCWTLTKKSGAAETGWLKKSNYLLLPTATSPSSSPCSNTRSRSYWSRSNSSVDVLNLGKAASTNQIENKALMIPQDKKMELCEQCGLFLVTNDVLERTQSRVTGKPHIGYGLVRDFLAEYRDTAGVTRYFPPMPENREAPEDIESESLIATDTDVDASDEDDDDEEGAFFLARQTRPADDLHDTAGSSPENLEDDPIEPTAAEPSSARKRSAGTFADEESLISS
ncbi:hypothetical protein ACQ4PT_018816 [Festuca glaucescens]